MAGLLDFLNTPQGNALASGLATYAATAKRGTPINNLGRGLLGGYMGYQNANQELEAKRKEAEKAAQWKAIMDAGKVSEPTFEQVDKPGFEYGGNFYDSRDEALKAAGIDPSRAVTQGLGERVPVDVRPIGHDGIPSQAPNDFFMGNQYSPTGMEQDGLKIPDIREVTRQFVVPGVPNERFDPRAALKKAIMSSDPDMAMNAMKGLSAYAGADSSLIENSAMEEVQKALRETGGDPSKAVQALLSVGNYKGASMLANAMKTSGGGTAAIDNWNQRKRMIESGASKEELAAFDAYVRANQMGNLGNMMVPFSGVTGAPTPGLPTVPNAAPGQPKTGYAIGLKPGELPSTQAAQESAKTAARVISEDRAKAQTNVGKVTDQGKYMLDVIDRTLNHPGKNDYIGTLTGGLQAMYPGSQAANFKTYFDQITGQQFLQAYETLKGGGQITEIEGDKAQSAIARMSRAQSVEEFDSSLREFRGIIQKGIDRSMGKAGLAPSQPTQSVKPKATVKSLMKGQVVNGYRYKGGDPNEPTSWELKK